MIPGYTHTHTHTHTPLSEQDVLQEAQRKVIFPVLLGKLIDTPGSSISRQEASTLIRCGIRMLPSLGASSRLHPRIGTHDRPTPQPRAQSQFTGPSPHCLPLQGGKEPILGSRKTRHTLHSNLSTPCVPAVFESVWVVGGPMRMLSNAAERCLMLQGDRLRPSLNSVPVCPEP